MKKIAVITSTRAEYGLLSPLIKELRKFENDEFKVELIVTGTHLSENYGMTLDEIEEDGVRVDNKINIPLDSATEMDISKNIAQTLINFTKHFTEKKYSAIIVLGDRYETLAIVIAAGNTHTPIFHLCGGDTTEGAMDEWIRHAITKMSYLHFPTNTMSEKRVVQLGEEPSRVFNYGSTSIDNIKSKATMSKSEALSSIGLDNCDYAVCTYHPATMETEDIQYVMNKIIEAIKSYPNIEFIFTKSNVDKGGAQINEILSNAQYDVANLHVFDSLGVKRYLSLVKHAEFVLGNSSSGIIEAPALETPTINIGDRQRGRLYLKSIINCKSETPDILNAIDKALSQDFKNSCNYSDNPYGNGNTAKKIAKKIFETVNNTEIDLKKSFYDIENKC